jgi:hypothetical protein
MIKINRNKFFRKLIPKNQQIKLSISNKNNHLNNIINNNITIKVKNNIQTNKKLRFKMKIIKLNNNKNIKNNLINQWIINQYKRKILNKIFI